jgi:uncharacterized protein YegP (UPF0339 family)
MENPKFQVFKNSANSQYYYRLKARNGEIVLNGEGYTTKQNCLNAIEAVKVNAPFDSRYEKSYNGKYYFLLKAANGQVIGVSEMYNSSQARETGIEAVKKDAPVSPVEDLT